MGGTGGGAPLFATRAWEPLEPLKWHKECKHRVQHIYTVGAYLGAVCDIDGDSVYCIQDDYRWRFWNFGLHGSELPYATMYLVVIIDGRACWCLVFELVNNMGRSPASNICSHFSICHVQSWERRMDDLAEPVVDAMCNEVKELVEARRTRLGARQARLWWGGAYTDDVILLLKGAALAAIAAREWDATCVNCKIPMAGFAKRGAGTVPVHIGGRFVLNGHFGTLPPAKKVRCLAGIREALERRALRDAYESNCGLLGHVSSTSSLLTGPSPAPRHQAAA
jgi:hypothetical protein